MVREVRLSLPPEGTAGGDVARVVGGVDRPVGKEEGELVRHAVAHLGGLIVTD